MFILLRSDFLFTREFMIKGWSFGGLTALEMAHCMPIDSGYRIKGIIMIDSVNPQYRPENVQAISYEPQFPEQTSVTTRRRISSAMRRATGLVDGWSLPDWDHQSLLPPRTAGSATAQPSSPYPRTILLRAQGWVPVQEEGCLCSIDVGRERRLLGWEDCGWPIVERVLDVTGHHYSVFDEENVGWFVCSIEPVRFADKGRRLGVWGIRLRRLLRCWKVARRRRSKLADQGS